MTCRRRMASTRLLCRGFCSLASRHVSSEATLSCSIFPDAGKRVLKPHRRSLLSERPPYLPNCSRPFSVTAPASVMACFGGLSLKWVGRTSLPYLSLFGRAATNRRGPRTGPGGGDHGEAPHHHRGNPDAVHVPPGRGSPRCRVHVHPRPAH